MVVFPFEDFMCILRLHVYPLRHSESLIGVISRCAYLFSQMSHFVNMLFHFFLLSVHPQLLSHA